jgi:hypothetical protein
MTVRDHLQKFHTHAAEQQTATAAMHTKMAKCHAAIAKASRGDAADGHSELADEHKAAASRCADAAAFHTDCCKELDKAVEPTLVKAFAPSAPPTLVPRPGQATPVVDTSKLPVEMQHLASAPTDN